MPSASNSPARKAWMKANKERVAATAKAWREANPNYYRENRDLEKERAYNIKRKYGLTTEEWNLLFESQDQKCAICEATEPGGTGTWHTDHCHKMGKVRGILCCKCNLGLGYLNDDPDRLEIALKYLRK